jgi:hypothetical protein
MTVEELLLAIKAKTDTIGTGKATLVAQVNRFSEVAVVQGRAYAGAYGNRLEWSDPTFNIAEDSVLVVTLHTVTNYIATRLSATALGLELTTAQTLTLPTGNLRYSVDEHKSNGQIVPYVYSAPWRVDPQPLPVYTP